MRNYLSTSSFRRRSTGSYRSDSFTDLGSNSFQKTSQSEIEDIIPLQQSMRLGMSKSSGDESESKKERNNPSRNGKDPNKRRPRNQRRNTKQSETETQTQNIGKSKADIGREEELLHRLTQLESLCASQAVQMRKLREEFKAMKDITLSFAEVVNLLRQAGLSTKEDESVESSIKKSASKPSVSSDIPQKQVGAANAKKVKFYEAFDDSEIFGTAPSSVIDAADAAGASVLAALLGGKQKMLVDVRDAELSRDPDILVQFIELTILPVAAGLEGLKMKKNRVKVVFPTVSMLMQYRRTMALSAPEVISLSTLGFDPVEEKDNLVVIVAPSPDDKEGLAAMNELLESGTLFQPVVVLNHHMVPLLGPAGDYEPVYHLRLLSVQYMTSDAAPPVWEQKVNEEEEKKDDNKRGKTGNDVSKSSTDGNGANVDKRKADVMEDAELEAAMEHAHELGVHQGVTRAMVIRAYPRPWHVFVDTSPDSDADFEVAATFDESPSQEDVNYAIVECLEGSEREDELVAQQMQEALESGQLNDVSDMLGIPNIDIDMDAGLNLEDDDGDDGDWDPWETDTV